MCHDASSKLAFLHKLFKPQQQKVASVSLAEKGFQYRMAFNELKKGLTSQKDDFQSAVQRNKAK